MSEVHSRDGERTEQELRARLARLDLATKVRLLSGRDHWSTYPAEEIGLRSIVLSDGTVGIRGVRWSEEDTSINTPSTPAVAATFDVEVAAAMGRVIGREARRKGVDVILGPVVNLQRSPFGGRHFEAFSEDPWLTAQLGAAMVVGMQAEGPATTVKHFVANEAETDRLTSNSVVAERVLRELYLAPFEEIVRAGGLGVMSAYNRVNGVLATDSDLVTDVLKGEWSFDGLVVSDWGAVRSVEDTARGGTDLAMPGPHTTWAAGLLDAVRAGRVAEDTIDDKVLRLLRLAARVGALDRIAPLVEVRSLPRPPVAESDEVRELLRRTAARGTVLLRNEGRTLPLDPSTLGSVALIGVGATTPRSNGGGSASVIAPATVSPLEALTAALPGARLRHAEGARPVSLVRTLTAANGTAPGGGGVALVEFLDAAGRVLGSELRDRLDTLIYGMGYPDGVPEDEVAAIRASTRLTVPRGGDYLFAGAGAGYATIIVDGETRFDAELVPINADAVIGMSLPPQAVVELAMTAGRPVDVVFTYTPARRTVAALRLGFDEVAPDDDALIDDAVEAARGADVALVFVGTSSEDEAEGFDRTTLRLPGRQDDLVSAVAAVNTRTVVVVSVGAPVLMPWRDDVAAIVLTWFGGQEMGPALADVLTGVAEPGGRLPVTFPAGEEGLPSPFPVEGDVVYSEGLDIGYRAHERSGREPAYAFGHGLGYTDWSVGGVAARETAAGVEITAQLANTGSRRGRQVVQVYASRRQSAVERPAMWYAGAAVRELPAGGVETVTIEIPRRLFEHWDVATGSWALEPGLFHLRVGTSSRELPQTAGITLT
ncbi:putative beta-glucosidase (Glycosyl hydrolase,family3) [Nostocoides japonicum T1-X7]|uniref:Putative beta-glucosidase (Glycosyl hydrolase,family3) n=1 Tax=Nostocoides japonicum T1-X7 TaxID=1194083 RepID=A0A077LX89_9MICO|nr:glycoside hydrolase family 3 C-terminal domain-containing protein [Tetrasphaera japonica]CCH76599.1 putative beta-glucosidase (Glycosyl hydrolase,family3) [Tetrasphaera japonica T1-X7]